MNQQTNLILRAAVAAALGLTAVSVHAGVASALPVTIATAAVKDDTTLVKGNSVTYSTQVPLSPNTTYFLYVKLATGKFGSTPTAASVFGAPTASNNATLAAILAASTGTLSTDKTFAVYPIATAANSFTVNTNITFAPTGTGANQGEINTLSSLIAGGNLNVQMSIGSASSSAAPLADIDSASGGNIVTFAAAQTFVSQQSGSFATTKTLNLAAGVNESLQINVSAGTGINMTTPVGGATNTASPGNLLDFGGFLFKDVAGVLSANGTGSTAWTIANIYTGADASATITGNFAAATTVAVNGAINCGAATTYVSTLNTAKTSATVTGITVPGTNTALFVCMNTDNKTTIPATQPTLVTSLAPDAGITGSTLTFPTSGTASLYSLQPNGGIAIVRAYIPAGATGYTDVVRIINTGQVAATVSVARIDPVTGVTGSSAVLPGGAVAAGGATNYSATTIETALGGAFAAGDRPRLQFTANTSIEAQNYIVNPNGTLTTLHSKD